MNAVPMRSGGSLTLGTAYSRVIPRSDHGVGSDNTLFLYRFCRDLETFLLPSVALHKDRGYLHWQI